MTQMFDPVKYHMVKVSGKRAFEKGWPDNPMSTGDYSDWRAVPGNGLGVVCGGKGDIYVVDVDDTELAVETLMKWSLPPTLTIETSTDKFHYIYRYTGTEKLRRKIKAYPGIDLLGIGGYIALHEPLKRYCVDHIAEMPQVLIDAWLSIQTKAAPVNLTIVEGNRNDSLYRYGCGLAGQGFTHEQVWQGINLENAGYQPPLDMAEVRQVFSQVEKHIQEAPPEVDISGIGYGETVTEFCAREYLPLPPLCGPIQGGSMTVISGAHKAGKSMFALHLGAHVATGEDMENWIVPAARKVLYIDGENQSRAQHERMRALNFPKNDNFRIAHRDFLRENFGQFTLTHPDCQEWLVNSDAALIIFDSLTALNPPDANTSMNDVEFIQAIMPVVDQLTSKGVGILTLHNLNKSNTSHGTNALAWRSDRLWHLYRREGFKPGKEPALKNHPDATAGMVLRALDGDRSLQEQAVDSEWQFFMNYGWRRDS